MIWFMQRKPQYLLDGLQHGPASVPGFGGFPDAVEAGHTVPLSVLQLPVEGVGQHQHTVVQVEVGHLKREEVSLLPGVKDTNHSLTQ